ncbi:hypothetical protein ACJJTC_013552, partial [Scirpophaga incertulas]
QSCQVDLVNAKGHKYFLSVLQDPTVDCEHRTMAAYVLATIVDNYPPGQEAALQSSMISICLEQTGERLAALRLWACVALGRLWRGYDSARWAAARDLAHEKLLPLLDQRCPEVRAACVFALGTLVGGGGGGARGDGGQHACALLQAVGAALGARAPRDLAVPVRAEILAALQWVVLAYEQHFIAVYIQERVRKSDKWGANALAWSRGPGPRRGCASAGATHLSRATKLLPSIGFGSVYVRLWRALEALAREPHPLVAAMGAALVRHVGDQVDSVAREVELGGGRGLAARLPRPPHAVADARGSRRSKTGLPHTISEDSVSSRDSPRDRDSTSSNSSAGGGGGGAGKRAAGEHAVRGMGSGALLRERPRWEWRGAWEARPGADPHARDHHSRAWRYARNRDLRAHALGVRVESQAFSSRCPLPPAVVLFPPLRPTPGRSVQGQLRDLGLGHGGQAVRGRVAQGVGARISALAYLNAHDHALLCAASHQGAVAVYRPSGSSTEPTLVAAWRGLDVRPPRGVPAAPRAAPHQSGAAGVRAVLLGPTSGWPLRKAACSRVSPPTAHRPPPTTMHFPRPTDTPHTASVVL